MSEKNDESANLSAGYQHVIVDVFHYKYVEKSL